MSTVHKDKERRAVFPMHHAQIAPPYYLVKYVYMLIYSHVKGVLLLSTQKNSALYHSHVFLLL